MPEEKRKPQVFISYSRRDLAFVEQLAADLKAADLDVWYDLSGLEGGSRWSRAIEKAIQDSQYVLVVLSTDSVASKWVEEEFLYASELGKKIVPLFYRQCSIPFGYRTLHFIDVQDEKYKKSFSEILRALGVKPVVSKKPPAPVIEQTSSKYLTEESKKTPKPEPKKTNLKINMRAITGFFGLIVIVIAGVFGISYIGDLFPKQLEATVTATITPRLLNATEVASISKVAPTQAPQTATASVFLTEVVIGDTQIPTETQLSAEITDDFGVEMILVPAGEFAMGSENISEDEKPVHQVYLDAFYMDIYEVTNTAYKSCVTAGSCTPPRRTESSTRSSYYGNSEFDDYPVIYVDWNQANTYCEWRGVSLPTEAQWEKAARSTDGRTYPWGEEISCKRANYYNCPGDTDTRKVGGYESGKSPYGIYDLAGNVWEWVADWYDAYPGNTVSQSSYGTKYRVIRGGAWNDFLAYEVRSAYRYAYSPDNSINYVGFRCAKDATP